MVGGTDAFLVVVGCVGTTSAGGNSGLHWKMIRFSLFWEYLFGYMGFGRSSGQSFSSSYPHGMVLHHRGE